jgi:hypothetical protein
LLNATFSATSPIRFTLQSILDPDFALPFFDFKKRPSTGCEVVDDIVAMALKLLSRELAMALDASTHCCLGGAVAPVCDAKLIGWLAKCVKHARSDWGRSLVSCH